MALGFGELEYVIANTIEVSIGLGLFVLVNRKL